MQYGFRQLLSEAVFFRVQYLRSYSLLRLALRLMKKRALPLAGREENAVPRTGLAQRVLLSGLLVSYSR